MECFCPSYSEMSTLRMSKIWPITVWRKRKFSIWKKILNVSFTNEIYLDVDFSTKITQSNTGVNKNNDHRKNECEQEDENRWQNINKVISNDSNDQNYGIRIVRTELKFQKKIFLIKSYAYLNQFWILWKGCQQNTTNQSNSRNSNNDVLCVNKEREEDEDQGDNEVVCLIVKQISHNSIIPLFEVAKCRCLKYESLKFLKEL